MQRSLKILFTLAALIAFVYGFHTIDNGNNSNENSIKSYKNISELRFKGGVKVATKSMTPFNQKYQTAWIDPQLGTAKIYISLNSQTFIADHWNYKWILPEGVTSTNTLNGVFDSTAANQVQYFEIEVSGLSSSQNQNIILNINSTSRFDSAISVVVPTIPEQTLESKIAKEFNPSSNLMLIQKSTRTKDPSNAHPGIQF